MPIQQIELEEVQMVETSDESLENTAVIASVFTVTNGCGGIGITVNMQGVPCG